MPKEFVSNSFKIFTVSFYAVNSYGDRSIVRSPANIIPGYINFSKALQTACLETLMEDKTPLKSTFYLFVEINWNFVQGIGEMWEEIHVGQVILKKFIV